MVLSIVITIAVCYALGNLNGAVIISRVLEKDDVRSHGSGNAGMTNFFRSYGASNTIFVILLDFGKAVLASLLGRFLLSKFGFGTEGAVLGGLFVVIGHNFPAVMHFKGGKGIMSSFGASFIIGWPVSLLLGSVFFLVYLPTRLVSLASVMAALSLLIAAPFGYSDRPYVAGGLMLMSALALFMHRENIMRLLRHSEQKTDFFKKENKK